MSTELRCEVNPFESPIKTRTSFTPATSPDILATADLLVEQLKELEDLYSSVEERVQHKRQALKEIEHLILGSNSVEGSPRSPVCPVNTPVGSRLHLMSPRLRGLFDLRGPGKANLDATQSCLDYSPDTLPVTEDVSTYEDLGHPEEWVDDDEEEALLPDSPFDDKYALRLSPRKTEKKLPAIPRVGCEEILESKIPRKVYVRREASTSKRLTGRPPSAVARSTSHRRRPSVRKVKAANAGSDLPTKGIIRRGSKKQSILENAKTKIAAGVSFANENESGRGHTRKKEKRKGLWSIYSVCSEFGLGGAPSERRREGAA